MKYKVQYSKQTKKFMKKRPETGRKFFKTFKWVSENKITNPYYYDISEIKDNKHKNVFRLIIEIYKAIFRIENDKIIVILLKRDIRKEVE
ncbi:hypothetical protein [Mesomycoplasma molare]|nr:hypothetical protein [Mesomycoplasma molare]